MVITYEEIFDWFLPLITDFDFTVLSEEDSIDLLNGMLHKSRALPSVRSLFNTLVLDDTETEVTCELKVKLDDDSDKEFVISVFALGMKIAWYQPQINSVLNIAQMYGGKEEKFYSQANHVTSIKDLFKQSKLELQKTIRDYKYFNGTYVGGGV